MGDHSQVVAARSFHVIVVPGAELGNPGLAHTGDRRDSRPRQTAPENCGGGASATASMMAMRRARSSTGQ